MTPAPLDSWCHQHHVRAACWCHRVGRHHHVASGGTVRQSALHPIVLFGALHSFVHVPSGEKKRWIHCRSLKMLSDDYSDCDCDCSDCDSVSDDFRTFVAAADKGKNCREEEEPSFRTVVAVQTVVDVQTVVVDVQTVVDAGEPSSQRHQLLRASSFLRTVAAAAAEVQPDNGAWKGGDCDLPLSSQ